jgi:hypothetical protein
VAQRYILQVRIIIYSIEFIQTITRSKDACAPCDPEKVICKPIWSERLKFYVRNLIQNWTKTTNPTDENKPRWHS